MKRISLFIAVVVFLLSAVSCDKESDAPAVSVSVETTAPPETEETTAAQTTTAPAETAPVTVVTIPEDKLTEMRDTLESLTQTVPDLYGWISIDNTDINYVVVQGEDNDYYLNMSPYKQWQEIGSIFVDYRNRKNVEDSYNYNIVMYGHNLTWGGMFHDVQTIYENEELFNNSYIYIYTLDGIYVYEPFAIYEANAYYQYFRTHFDYPWEFEAFANEMKGNSIYEKEVELTGDDRMLTLSTCTNTYVDGRYALQAKLVQVTRW